MPDLGESGHPVFRGTSALAQGPLKCKGGGETLIHHNSDSATVELWFRIVISATQSVSTEQYRMGAKNLISRFEIIFPVRRDLLRS